MKNNLILIFLLFFFSEISFAENIFIESKKVFLEKKSGVSVFEEEVVLITEDKDKIKSDFAEHNQLTGIIKLKENIRAIDALNNIIEANYAEYNEKDKTIISEGPTKIITSQEYIIEGSNIILDNKNNFIKSSNSAIVTDQDNNKIYLDSFEYLTKKNIFKSIGYIKIIDNMDNTYEFTQIYIDTKKKEILGTDSRAFINDNNFKVNELNKPRIFSNTIKIDKETSTFDKSIFTICDYRKNDKCPPWTVQASKMLHDKKKKTIYYDNAVIKVFNVPIFFTPILSHPDPTVTRRTGLLPPTFSNRKNLGFGVAIPFFWAVNDDKNFTITQNIFASENPLFVGEYHQAFKNSNLMADLGYTKGYKKHSAKKKAGDKSHFFSIFIKEINLNDDSENSFSLSVQNVSNDKYLKLYKLDSSLVDYKKDTLENTLDFYHQKDDVFFNLSTSVYENLKDNVNDKYEYILPELIFDKNLLSNDKIGVVDLQTNLKVRNYDTNKYEKFLVNKFDWNIKDFNFQSGFKGKLSSLLKNINYETKNVKKYTNEPTSEFHGALGYLTEVNLTKNQGSTNHFLKPKILMRYAPGSMRQEKDEGGRLTPIKAFSLDRLSNIYNFESGLSSTLGLDYKIKKKNKDFDFSLAQIINNEENKKMPSKTSLDEKLSDLVGSAKFGINDKYSLNYNFSLDQNYNDLNYNEIGADMNFNKVKFNVNYLQESKHIGDQEYFKTKLDYNQNKNLFSFEAKRNLVTNSAEFYNLSYEYLNDCLRAGLVYRREFYNDSELEPENTLMFKVTLVPFGDINTPSLNK